MADVITDLYVNLGPMLFDGLLIEHQCRPRAVAAAGTSTIIVYRNLFLSSLLGRPIQCLTVSSRANESVALNGYSRTDC